MALKPFALILCLHVTNHHIVNMYNTLSLLFLLFNDFTMQFGAIKSIHDTYNSIACAAIQATRC
jgi:hypothetical protein